jgi:hypothetical protein
LSDDLSGVGIGGGHVWLFQMEVVSSTQ